MKRTFLLALLIAAPLAANPMQGPTRPKPAERGEALLRQTVIGAHNRARVAFGVPTMAWSDRLAAEAMQHASYMARTGVYGHDRTPGRRKTQGENLWRGQRGAFSYDVMVGMMIDEQRLFRPGAFPHNAANGDWHAVAHYTQIVWPTTTEVGCAVASNAATDFFVCRYSPTGNKDGVYLARRTDPLAPGAGSVQLAERGD